MGRLGHPHRPDGVTSSPALGMDPALPVQPSGSDGAGGFYQRAEECDATDTRADMSPLGAGDETHFPVTGCKVAALSVSCRIPGYPANNLWIIRADGDRLQGTGSLWEPTAPSPAPTGCAVLQDTELCDRDESS